MKGINKSQKKYKKEEEEKWGRTDAYRESILKTSRYSNSDWAKITSEANVIYKGLAKNIHNSLDCEEVQKLISQWRKNITKYYYNCTIEVFAGLGKTYITDERFTKNIDKNGKGLAEFMSKTIELHCSKHTT